jgi:hypothetical protein
LEIANAPAEASPTATAALDLAGTETSGTVACNVLTIALTPPEADE